ncbi:hypothetical protein [Legionella longbeachae]|uniref:Uncharacterized protein n=1 Tax=Legionella longbeachae serogroup 1 (strain NSW150) TaxID=661367 RepID=D3HJD3_LEGLN|nr:hypothetical protein [Legionella longbeachae]HBD7398751.1 hypothetical protein [Legionella pneumophila]ARM32831.1 hypothetical protein B0B39_04570 [Legionella longbeachae]EEZ94363.1 hypothetical protein LLB_3268 [Legionella longbeachae D-4968]QIN32801.1 hypothetical protein GCB94_11955 [Legionella longbeachae]CBJ12525.1 hypothetical protein LLO_2134 [Legionella longbeachae NSW150]
MHQFQSFFATEIEEYDELEREYYTKVNELLSQLQLKDTDSNLETYNKFKKLNDQLEELGNSLNQYNKKDPIQAEAIAEYFYPMKNTCERFLLMSEQLGIKENQLLDENLNQNEDHIFTNKRFGLK